MDFFGRIRYLRRNWIRGLDLFGLEMGLGLANDIATVNLTG